MLLGGIIAVERREDYTEKQESATKKANDK